MFLFNKKTNEITPLINIPIECDHHWSKWSDKERKSVKTTTEHNRSYGDRTVTVVEDAAAIQERRCNKCNILELVHINLKEI